MKNNPHKTMNTQKKQSIEKEQEKAINKYTPVYSVEDVEQLTQQAKREAVEEMIELSDKIEARELDGGTKQWMAFKAFRNEMRDKLLITDKEHD